MNPKPYFITGSSGIGKSTIIPILKSNLTDDKVNGFVIDTTNDTPNETVTKITSWIKS